MQKFLFLVFRHFLRDNHFENAPEEGLNPQIFISILQILIIWAPSIQNNICSFIWIWWVWMTGLPIASGLCLNSLFSRIFRRGNFSPYICLYLKCSTYQLELNAVEDNWLIHSSYFCCHEYKIIFCNKLYIFPHPKIAIFFKSCII